jgi:DUF1365 family protein
MKSAFYTGTVIHRRLRPLGHLLKYRVFYLFLDLDEIDLVQKTCLFFSNNRFNLLTYKSTDFGGETAKSPKYFIQNLVKKELDIDSIHRVRLLFIPRLMGFAFNPISTFFCYNRDEKILAIVYEVRNTFGEKIHYVLPVKSGAEKMDILEQSCLKQMYVSPFISVNSRYHFRIKPPAELVTLAIHQTEDAQPVLNASFIGKRKKITRFGALTQAAFFPLNSIMVIVGIYFEALKLWIKGVSFKERKTKVQIENWRLLQKEKIISPEDIYE